MLDENHYAVRSTLVVTEDPSQNVNITKHLSNLGISNVAIVKSGKEAWKKAGEFPFDLVIMGWRLDELKGLALFNRLRLSHQYINTPIIVISQSLTAEEFALLSEFPCSLLLEGPPTASNISDAWDKVIREASWHVAHTAHVENLIDIADRDAVKALALLRGPLAKAPYPAPLVILVAKKLRESGFLAEAERLLRDHVTKVPKSPVAYAELGKVLHLAKRFPEAIEALSHAQIISPKNIQRLCLLGDIELARDNPNGALANFARVLEIDVTNVAAKVGVKLIKEKRSLTDRTSPGRSLVGMINIAAIVRVRKQKFEEGIDTYLTALNLSTDREAQMKLSFNLGLGFYKWGKNKEATESLKRAVDLGNGTYDKAGRLLARIQSGAPVETDDALLVEEAKLDFTIDEDFVVEVVANTDDFDDEKIG